MLLGEGSPFARFMALCDWLWTTTRQTHGIALVRLFELLLRYVKEHELLPLPALAHSLWRDYRRDGRTDKPSFLAGFDLPEPLAESRAAAMGTERQSRHRIAGSKRSRSAELESAYRTTDYCVDGPIGRFAIRIGQTSQPLDELLLQDGAPTWAYITACNPKSKQLSEAENAERMRQLEAEVIARGYRIIRGEGVGEAGDWRETSLLVIGVDRRAALELAREYEQNAFVFGTRTQPAVLVWTDETFAKCAD
jgi:hypothetical protein